MIYRIVSIIIIIVLTIVLIQTMSRSRQQQLEIDRLRQELVISNQYIQSLNEQLMNSNHAQRSIEAEEERLRKVLNNYLKEKKSESVTTEDLTSYEKKDRFIPNLIPIKGEYAISQFFSEDHPAIDFAAAEGTEVLASAAGEILAVYEDEYFGKVVLIDHLNEYATMYAHLAMAIYESKTFVKKGEPIGLVGNTGNSSAPHLHFEILEKGKNINPKQMLSN